MKRVGAKRRTKAELSRDEEHLLENVILPRARSWVSEYGTSSTLYGHGKQTLEYWDEWDGEKNRPL